MRLSHPADAGAGTSHSTCARTLPRFTTAEGAGPRGQTGAQRLAGVRIYDWLDNILAASR
jgi:hypothetical protein